MQIVVNFIIVGSNMKPCQCEEKTKKIKIMVPTLSAVLILLWLRSLWRFSHPRFAFFVYTLLPSTAEQFRKAFYSITNYFIILCHNAKHLFTQVVERFKVPHLDLYL